MPLCRRSLIADVSEILTVSIVKVKWLRQGKWDAAVQQNSKEGIRKIYVVQIGHISLFLLVISLVMEAETVYETLEVHFIMPQLI